MPTPHRRCCYIPESGLQCESWFPAIDGNKLCAAHAAIATPANGFPEVAKVKYIDLVNDQREYCYKFIDGESQQVDRTLIFEYKDTEDGTKFEKIDRHIAFLEKVIEDVKARLFATSAVKRERLDQLTEDERKELRKIKVAKEVQKAAKAPSVKADPLKHLMMTKGMSAADAKAFLEDDIDALMAKYKAAKEGK